MVDDATVTRSAVTVAGSVLAPLALAQFICSFAGSNMNVMISAIAQDLDTTVQGVQTAITLFLLVMAALMIPGGKLTDKFGRKKCLVIGLVVYGIGAVIAGLSQALWMLMLGYSILQGVGTALLIPPVYILTTLYFTDLTSRAKAFGTISALGGVGAAAGPLIGGLITSALSWRAAYGFQAVIVATIVVLASRTKDPLPADPRRPFDVVGAILSAGGLVLLVSGILALDNSLAAVVALLLAGAVVLSGFFVWVRSRERAGREVLLSSGLFRNATSNLGMVTQNVQWLVLMGGSFTVSVYLQVEKGYDAIQTGLIFTAATVGILLSSLAAGRFARRRPQRTLIVAGFAVTAAGIGLLVVMAGGAKTPWYYAPGLFLLGFGVGTMLTPSVNVVQSSFGEDLQGEISGLSRSVSNLGSSLGTAITGTILAAVATAGYATAMISLAVIALVGLVAGLRLPAKITPVATTAA